VTDPFDALTLPPEPIEPRPDFARQLRSRLVAALDLPVQLTERKQPMPTDTSTRPASAAVRAHAVTPYLCAHDGAAALAFYTEAFGAVEHMRVVADDGRLGHAEFTIGAATFYLSDEYAEYGVLSPRTLGGTTLTLHLDVDGVDAVYARAVAAGATAQGEPADQPHGARHGTLIDPFGHRWMVSQQLEPVSVDEYAARSRGSGFTVEPGTRAAAQGAVWASLVYADARAGIAFLTDVLGFEPRLVVPDEGHPDVVVHSQLVWPEGGVVQASTAGRDGNPYSDRPIGKESLYVVTADPDAVWARCQAAGVEVVQEPMQPEYAPGTTVFSVRDPEGNIFSFGQYSGS
jgi:PhnB protein